MGVAVLRADGAWYAFVSNEPWSEQSLGQAARAHAVPLKHSQMPRSQIPLLECPLLELAFRNCLAMPRGYTSEPVITVLHDLEQVDQAPKAEVPQWIGHGPWLQSCVSAPPLDGCVLVRPWSACEALMVASPVLHTWWYWPVPQFVHAVHVLPLR